MAKTCLLTKENGGIIHGHGTIVVYSHDNFAVIDSCVRSIAMQTHICHVMTRLHANQKLFARRPEAIMQFGQKSAATALKTNLET